MVRSNVRYSKIPRYLFSTVHSNDFSNDSTPICILILLTVSPDPASFLPRWSGVHTRPHPSMDIVNPSDFSLLSLRWVDRLGVHVPEKRVQRRSLQRSAGQIATTGQSVSRSRTSRILVNGEVGLRMLRAAFRVVVGDLVAAGVGAGVGARRFGGVVAVAGDRGAVAGAVSADDVTRVEHPLFTNSLARSS